MFLGLLIITLVIVFSVVELVAIFIVWCENKFFFEDVSRKDYIDKEYHNYLNWVENWDKPMFRYIPVGFRIFNNDNPISEKVQNNSLGYRCPEFSERKNDVMRIAVVGGSAAWGCGSSSNSTTIAGYLESTINNKSSMLDHYKCKSVESFNLAQVNATQTHDILTLSLYAIKVRPQIVISFTGWNELVTNKGYKKEILENYGIFYLQELEGWESDDLTGNKKKFLKKYFKLWCVDKFTSLRRFKLIGREFERSHSLGNISERIEIGGKIFLENLTRMQALSKAYGFDHIQVFQPNVYRKKNLTESEVKIIDLYDNVRQVHGGSELGDYLRENNIYKSIIDEVQKFPQKYGNYLDLSDIFMNEKDSMFFTLVHLRDVGYQKVAEKITKFLLKNKSKLVVQS